MGCDIHLITEIRKGGKWQFVEDRPESLLGRNYSLFAFLADVRNSFNYDGFSEKGLPEDLSGKKFFFESERHFYESRFNEGDTMFVAEDGTIVPNISDSGCMIHLSEEEYNKLHKEMDNLGSKQDNPEGWQIFDRQYQYLGYSCSRGEYDYHVYDAYSKNGHFEQIPWSKIYPDFETFMKEKHSDEWDEDAQDYGYWKLNFNHCEKYGDYHTPSWLTLQEMLDKDTTTYTSNRYKMNREFYETFVKAGGVFPDVFTVEGNTKPGDIADCFAEAFQPTVIVSWQKTDEEKKKQAYFCGIEELKEIAKKYDVTDYNDIRIVFAFDN